MRRFATEWTREIIDVTPFVVEQREHRGEGARHKLLTPVERVYVPHDEALQQRLRLGWLEGSLHRCRTRPLTCRG